MQYNAFMNRISVLIITRNRSEMLKSCLLALAKQTVGAYEVIVVDNGSDDNTAKVCQNYRKLLPLKYFFDPRIGIPYARNTCLRQARGNILAFVDDDCMVNHDWIKAIQKHFATLPLSLGVVGETSSADNNSVPGLIEAAYHYRRLLQHVASPQRRTQLLSGQFIDFKNAAFESSFIKRFYFATDVPFGDVGNEDIEVGTRIYQANQLIFYDPAIKVKHTYSPTFSRLLQRNFWSGFSDQILLKQKGINLTKTPYRYSLSAWINYCTKNGRYLHNWASKLLYWAFLFAYPLFSKAGRIWAKITMIFDLPSSVPSR